MFFVVNQNSENFHPSIVIVSWEGCPSCVLGHYGLGHQPKECQVFLFFRGFIPEIPEIHHHLPSGSFIPPKWGSKNWWIPPSDWQATHILLLSIETYHAKNCFIMKLQERRSNFFSSIIKTSGVFFPARMHGMFTVLDIYHKNQVNV